MSKLIKRNRLSLWFVPISSDLKPLTKKEFEWEKELSDFRFKQFHHSRGYVREVLSHLWDIKPLEIPLNSPPGISPELANGMGYLSFSHCIDGLFIGWSERNIGVDIERMDRSFKAKLIMNKVFSKEEQKNIFKNLGFESTKKLFLSHWVRKEAAIKWQKSSISKDIGNWIYDGKSKMMLNKKRGLKIYSFFKEYDNWYISVACEENPEKTLPIICRY